MTAESPARRQTVIGHSAADKAFLYGGLPLTGLLLGYFLPRIADWAAAAPWVPLQGPLKVISGWDSWWVPLLFAVVGLIVGVVLAGAALEDTLKVTVTDTAVEFWKNNVTRVVARTEVEAAFLDGKDIVLQDAGSRELARERHDEVGSQARRIAVAFQDHGYPWRADGDPYREAFRRWVEDDPELPPAVNAVLRARFKASARGDKGKDDLRELREEIAKLGFVVRDEDKKQYWRPLPPG